MNFNSLNVSMSVLELKILDSGFTDHRYFPLSTKFAKNTLIITTIDFLHFTGVTSIVNQAFVRMSEMTTFYMPPNVTSTGTYILGASGNTNMALQTITLNDGLKTIGDAAFAYNSANPITIPSTVTRLGSMFIRWGVPSKRTLIMEGTTPPTLASNALYDVYRVYVPDDYVDTYKAASGWTSYATYVYPVSQYTG